MTRDQKFQLQELETAVIEDMVSYMKYGGAENETDPDYDPAWVSVARGR